MLQAPLTDCQCLDLCSLPQNCFVAAEVNVGGSDVVQALVVALVVVILDEGPDLVFKVAGEVVISQQHSGALQSNTQFACASGSTANPLAGIAA
jgi:hypothetical protein